MTQNTNNKENDQQSLYHITTERGTNLKHLIQQSGVIPFAGLNKPISYPDSITQKAKNSPRFTDSNVAPFVEAIDPLPEAFKVRTYAENMFINETDDDEYEVDMEAALNVDGFDYDQIEEKEGKSLEELIQDADAPPVHQLPSRKVVTDKRRQLLRLAGWSIKSEWQVASNRYTPLNVDKFFGKKAKVCEENNLNNAFGWIRYRDYGGEVTITTIYQSIKHEVDVASDDDVEDIETLPEEEQDRNRLVTTDTEETETKVAYFGDQVRYNFMSKSRLKIVPIVYFPDDDLTIPLNMGGDELVRRQMGSLMEDIEDHHEEVITELKDKTADFNDEIMKARKIAIDFNECDFTIEEFFEYLGLDTDKYVKSAAERARQFADKPSRPTIWNLQLSLKRTLIEEFTGDRAGDRYIQFEEIAGQLLRFPEAQVRLAIETHHRNNNPENEEKSKDKNQSDLEDFDNLTDIEGVTEGSMTASEAQLVQEHIESKIDS